MTGQRKVGGLAACADMQAPQGRWGCGALGCWARWRRPSCQVLTAASSTKRHGAPTHASPRLPPHAPHLRAPSHTSPPPRPSTRPTRAPTFAPPRQVEASLSWYPETAANPRLFAADFTQLFVATLKEGVVDRVRREGGGRAGGEGEEGEGDWRTRGREEGRAGRGKGRERREA